MPSGDGVVVFVFAGLVGDNGRLVGVTVLAGKDDGDNNATPSHPYERISPHRRNS